MLQGKTVIVTGVGGGLGRECVAAALREGANVIMAARTQATLDAVAAELDPSGERLAAQAADITDEAACAAVVELATEKFGSVDALIQVAAFEMAFGGLWDSQFKDWRTAYETNVIGALTLIRPVAEAMKAKGGSIVLIGSQSMFKPQLPQAGYAASKGALLSTMYYLADELGEYDIRCNMVVPSWMWGPPVQLYVDIQSQQKSITKDEALQEIVADFPLRRMTEDGEVADVAMFFASDHAKAVTGQHLLVNSGEMMS
ncbi:SDR family oxidoreductase [Actinomadura barringtoniae]|uniref:SDR family oxidoreductase n=1 Tax=Actinomadura barringtoniae TaxID=1427535 RepID=A0A939PP58_9ACTN|nr:SDR family oxidoreductase [Actinomadura barringtoniae]MBO2455840.1 SDR family oxidoreductase [Actinomadura barringtoniae]